MSRSSDSISKMLSTWDYLPTHNGRILYEEPTHNHSLYTSRCEHLSPRAFCIACFQREWISIGKSQDRLKNKRKILYKEEYMNPMMKIKPKFDLAPIERLDSLPAEESETNSPFLDDAENTALWKFGTKTYYENSFPDK